MDSNDEVVRFRKSLLLDVKECITKLMPLAHNGTKSIDPRNPRVITLCENIEICLFYGIRLGGFNNCIPFYGFLERCNSNYYIHEALNKGIDAVSSIYTIRSSPLAKARAFIRYSMVQKTLDDVINFISNQPRNLIRQFYHSHGIMLSAEDSSILVAILRSMNALPKFEFNLADPDLLLSPPWLVERGSLLKDVFDVLSVASKALTQTQLLDDAPPSTIVDSVNTDKKSPPHDITSDELCFGLAGRASLMWSLQPPHSTDVTKMTPLYGTSLRDIILDNKRCSYSTMEPRLGIPNQILLLIHFISERLDTPNLFRRRGHPDTVTVIRRSLEQEHGIPTEASDIFSISQCLIQYLCELPEPLLGFQHYKAYHDCCQTMNGDTEDERRELIRNLGLLVTQTPWYSQPLLYKIVSLLAAALYHNASNGMTISSMAVLASPFILRSPGTDVMKPTPSFSRKPTRTVDSYNRMLITSATINSSILQILLSNTQIFDCVKNTLQDIHMHLKQKCSRVRELVTILNYDLIIDLSNNLSSEEEIKNICFKEIQVLWQKLESVELRRRTIESTKIQLEQVGEDLDLNNALSKIPPSNFESLLNSPRWELCGFAMKPNPFMHFSSYGLMTIRCLSYALSHYEGRVSGVIVEFALNRTQFCQLSQICNIISRFVVNLLELVDSGDTPSSNYNFLTLSSKPSWQLFNDENSNVFEELFVMSLLYYDDNWKRMALRKLPTTSETSAICMQSTAEFMMDILRKNPQSVENYWELWAQFRLDKQILAENLSLSVKNQSLSYQRFPAYGDNADESMDTADFSVCIDKDFSQVIQASTSSTTSGRSDTTQALNKTDMNSTQLSLSTAYKQSQASTRKFEDDDSYIYIYKKKFSKIETKVVSHYGPSEILTDDYVQQIENGLPKLYQCQNWKLLFRLTKDGANLGTLVRKARDWDSTLLVIKDGNGAVFGALITEKIRMGSEKYYGSGSICVFDFKNHIFTLYPSANLNSYYMITTFNLLAFGGGGNFAILLDGDLNRGSSGECLTFSSPCLSSSSPFTCIDCELYGFLSPFS